MAGRESAHLPIEVLGDPLIAAHGEDSRSHLGALIPAGAAYASHHAVLEQSNHGALLDDDLFSGSLGGMSMGGIFPAGNSHDASVIVYAQPSGVMDSRDCHSLMGLMSPQHSRHVPVASDVVLPAAHNASRQHHVAHGFLHGAGYNAVPPQPTTDHFPISVVPLPPSTPGGHQPCKYEAGKVARASPDGEIGEKKLQGTWTAEENTNFFNALRAHGRSFDKIHDEMGGTKSREQVLTPARCCVPLVAPTTDSSCTHCPAYALALERLHCGPQTGCVRDGLVRWRA